MIWLIKFGLVAVSLIALIMMSAQIMCQVASEAYPSFVCQGER